jgi:hypothetical protein
VDPDRPQRVGQRRRSDQLERGVGAAGKYLADLAGDVPVVDEHVVRAGLGDRPGARTAEKVADEYADFALRIAGFVPDRPSLGGRAQQGPDDPNR